MQRDRAFAEVLRRCADREDTWINAEIEHSYNLLNRAGQAHSIEVWRDDALVGGLYGIALGRVFFGESMFTRRTDASKLSYRRPATFTSTRSVRLLWAAQPLGP